MRFYHLGDVFAEDIEFKVHFCAGLDTAEVCMLESVGDNSHAEASGLAVAYGQAHAVDSHAAFLNSHIAFAFQLWRFVVFEFEVCAAVYLLDFGAYSCGVNMTLDDMPVKASVKFHAALEVHKVAGFQLAEVGAVEGFGNGCDGVRAVVVQLNNSQGTHRCGQRTGQLSARWQTGI